MSRSKRVNRKGSDRGELVRTWLEIQRNWWAFDLVCQVQENDPQEAWSVIKELVLAADSDELIEIVGAGPLEDFVHNHSGDYIAEFERLVAESDPFRKAFRNVNIDPSASQVSERLVALGCRIPACYR